MYVNEDGFREQYNKIKEDALKGDVTVLLCVAPDVDGLAAAQMLMEMFKIDLIKYTLWPVASYEDFDRARDEMKQMDSKYRSVVMINAGGTIDVVHYFEADEGQSNAGVSFYIIDSHRPLNLANVWRDRGVILFVDRETEASFPRPEEVFNDSDSDNDDEEGGGAGPRSKRNRGDEDEPAAVARRQLRRERDQRQRDYYNSSFYGSPAALVLWKISADLTRGSNPLLWLACVGLTNHFLSDHMDSTTYAELSTMLIHEVNRLNVTDGDTGRVAKTAKMQILCKEEYQFVLLRHWSLLEAMSHSRYIATRLGVWRGRGRDRLHNLFAKMGLSLEQCRQAWTSLQRADREKLSVQLEKYAGDYNIDNYKFPSFLCHTQFGSQMSAADAAHAVEGILSRTSSSSDRRALHETFYRALDALALVPTPASVALASEGMRATKELHAAILKQMDNLIDGKKGLRKASTFRYVLLTEAEDQRLFCNPLSLSRLGLFLIDSFRFNKDSRKRSMPVIIAAHNPENDTYLVVGLWTSTRRMEGAVVHNQFAPLFAEAASRIAANVSQTTFDASVLEIKAGEMLRFIGALEERLTVAQSEGRIA